MKYPNKLKFLTGFSIFLIFLLILLRNHWFSLNVLSSLLCVWVFYFIDIGIGIKFEFKHYFYIIIIVILGILFSPLYQISITYDKILHFSMPILFSSIIFFMINRLNIKLRWKLFITVGIAFSFLAFFEIIEYLLDSVADLKLQGVHIRDSSGLFKGIPIMDKNTDTMIDLILGLAGCYVFAISKSIANILKKREPKK